MTTTRRDTIAAVLPYAVWMLVMLALPSTAAGYALRTGLALVAFVGALRRFDLRVRGFAGWAWGIVGGILVLAAWVLPEHCEWYRRCLVIGSTAATDVASPYDPAVCGWPATLVRLAGSAFVIAPAEELFFRSFLYRRLQSGDWTSVPERNFDLSAFLWTTGLFALEHDRIVVAALAGAAYGFIFMRRGIGSAILAHVVTNLALGVHVIVTGNWMFW